MKQFIGSDIHFIAFEKNLFKHDKCTHIKHLHQVMEGKIYKVAGSEIDQYIHNHVMQKYINGDVDLEVMPESLLYKKF